MPGAGWEGATMYKHLAVKWIIHGDVMYNMVTSANNPVLCVWDYLRVNIRSSHHNKNNW